MCVLKCKLYIFISSSNSCIPVIVKAISSYLEVQILRHLAEMGLRNPSLLLQYSWVSKFTLGLWQNCLGGCTKSQTNWNVASSVRPIIESFSALAQHRKLTSPSKKASVMWTASEIDWLVGFDLEKFVLPLQSPAPFLAESWFFFPAQEQGDVRDPLRESPGGATRPGRADFSLVTRSGIEIGIIFRDAIAEQECDKRYSRCAWVKEMWSS